MSEEFKPSELTSSTDPRPRETSEPEVPASPAPKNESHAILDLWDDSGGTVSHSSSLAAEEKKRPEVAEEPEPPEKEATAADQLVEALGRFVKEQAATQQEEGSEKSFTVLQIAVFLLVTCDLVLAYMSLPPDVLEIPVIKFAKSLIPWLLGASAFAYATKLRVWLLKKCDNRWTAVSALLVFLFLLPIHFPLFSFVVELQPRTKLQVNAEQGKQPERVHESENKVRIGPAGLKNYNLSISNNDMNVANAKTMQVKISRLQLVKSTLAQLPVLGRAFGFRSVALTPLYGINVKSSSGSQEVEVIGSFPPGFVESSGYWNTRDKDGRDVVSIPIILQGLCRVDLPYGTYDFRVRQQQDCFKVQKLWKVQGSGELFAKIDFDKLPCSDPN